jgi:hypothetical protein
MMSKKLIFWNTNLYWINLALLMTHEIDSAYWREWDLFGLPGSIQGFLIMNLILIGIALHGFRKILTGEKSGYVFALLLAISGIAAFIVHLWYLLKGYHEFAIPASLCVLAGTFVVSLVQGARVMQSLLKQK